MPDFEFTLPDGEKEPLFPTNDPLTFTFIDGEGERHRFHAADEGRAPDDRRVSMDGAPISYMIEAIAGQAIPEQETEVKRLAWELWEQGLLEQDKVKELIEFLIDARKNARREQVKRKTRRPMTAPLGSSS